MWVRPGLTYFMAGRAVFLRGLLSPIREVDLTKVLALLDCPTVSSEEFVAVDDDNMYRAPIMPYKDLREFVESSKSIIDADSDDEYEMNNAALVPTSSKVRDMMKIMRSYVDTYSND
ncbi:SCAN domain-containing protein 3 [Trichonephila clavipes]|uniref:SCAN domain-containing protein 3 n=1 Tax=Trichonephila clavipes TaxID=2585209 RepID=A0A8X6WE09_TRICX|nr:SCAN domain-containing protein 3 [Trichonephila clavipes]